MASGKPVGTMFASIDLDATKLEQGLKKTHDALVSGTIKVEDAYKSLGVKSDQTFEMMRKNATAAVDFIKNKTLSSKEEIVRAEQAAAEKIKQINEQQHGKQTSHLDTMKKHWIATAAAVTAAWMAVGKAMEYVELGAKAEQAAESFRIVSAASGANADKLIADMKRAAAGTVDDSDIMQKAVSGMVKGLSADQVVKIMEVSRVAARVAGEDVKTAYEGITDAIANQMPKALKKYGLITMEQQSIVKKALAAGVEDVNLYSMAMANATIQAAKMGELSGNAAEGVQIFKASINELKESLGGFLIILGQKLLGVMQVFGGMLTYMIAPIAYLIDGQEGWNTAIEAGNELLLKAGKTMGNVTEEEKAAAAAATEGAVAKVDAAKAVLKAEEDRLKAATIAAKEGKKIEEETKKAIAETAALRAQAAEDTTIVGQQVYAADVARIAATIKEHQRLGVAAVTTAKWAAAETEKAGAKADVAEKNRMQKVNEEAKKFYADYLNQQQKDQENALQARVKAEYAAMEDILKGNIYYNEQMRKARGASETDTLKAQEAEQTALLRLKQEALVASITELTTFEETLVIMTKYKDLENQIAVVKDKTATDLIVRRIKIEQELLDIQSKQNEIVKAIAVSYAAAALNAIGLSKTGQLVGFVGAVDAGEDIYRKQYDEWLTWQEKKIMALEEKGNEEQAIKEAFGEIDLRYEEMRSKQKLDILEGMFGTMAEIAKTFYVAGGQQGGAAFELYKALSIGETVVSTAKAAMGAYSAMSGIPYVGPALGIAAAAAAIAAGAAQVAAIKSARPGSSSVAAISGGGGGGASAQPPSAQLGAAPGTASDSVLASYKLLEETYKMEYRELTNIYNALKMINSNITSLIVGIFQGGKIGTAAGIPPYQTIDPGNAARFAGGRLGTFGQSFLSPDPIMGMLQNLNNPITNMFKKWVSDAYGSIFGGKKTMSLDFSGLKYSAISVADLISEKYIDVIGYQIVKTVKDGGWFRKDKTSYDYYETELPDPVKKAFSSIFLGMSNVIIETSKILGTDIEAAKAYIFKAGELDLKGLDADAMNKKLMEYFSTIGDKAITDLFGNVLLQFQKVGEGLMETAARIVMDVGVVTEIIERTGQAFNGTGIEMVIATEDLIELAGGLDKLTDAASMYIDKFYTDAEKQQQLANDLSLALGDVNLALPDTRQGYRDLLESLDLTTESGRAAYVMLLQLAEGADALYAAQEALTKQYQSLQDRLLGLQGNDAEILARQRQRELDATDKQLHVLLKAIYAQEDYNAAVEETKNAQAALDTAIENTKTAMDNLAAASARVASAIAAIPLAQQGVVDANANYAAVIQDGVDRVADAQERYADAVKDGAERVAHAQKVYEDSLQGIVDAQKSYADAVKNGAKAVADAQKGYADAVQALADEIAAQALAAEIKALEERLKFESDARKAEIDNLNAQKQFYEDQANLFKDQLDAQKDVVGKFQSISESVKKWLSGMATGPQAPVQSRDAFEAQYQALKGAATGPDATAESVSEFLDFAKQYLEFQRAYGGDYLAIYDQVMADVAGIGEIADEQLVIAQAQLDTMQSAADDAVANAERIAVAIESAQAADEAANEAGQAALDALNATADDSAQRLADLQQAIVDAQQAIVDAQISADESIADAAQGIIDAQESSDEAFLAIGEAQVDATKAIADALEAIGKAEEDAAKSAQSALDAIQKADEALVAAIAEEKAAREAEKIARDELKAAQEEEKRARARLIEAQEEEKLAFQRLQAALEALKNAPPPVVIVNVPPPTVIINNPAPLPPPSPQPPPTQPPYIPPPYPEDWFIDPNTGIWRSPLGAVGGLYDKPTIGGEAGPEWFVPTYEPERSNFLRNAPDAFWSNLSKQGAGAVGPSGSGEYIINTTIVLDGKVVAESVAKHIPRSAELSEAIKGVARRG